LQTTVKVSALEDGGYVVTWRSNDGGDNNIRARIFEADGMPAGDDFVVNSTTAGSQLTPSVTTLDDGRIFMVWSSADSPTVIRGRVFESDGSAVGDDFVVNDRHGATAAVPNVAAFTNGSVVVTWRTTLSGATTIMAKTLDLSHYSGNTAPTAPSLSASQVAENSPHGTVVGQLSATDSDGDLLTYTLTDNGSGRFSLLTEGGVTKLIVAGDLDYESTTSHDVTVKVADGRGGESSATFTISVTDFDETSPEEPVDPLGAITLDASGSNGMDFETFIRGGFLGGTSGSGFPVFDNSAAFAGEEMFIGYGENADAKYVFAHGNVQYAFGTHTVAGTVNTIEYGTQGTGSFDANGYFAGGSVQLRITGLAMSNALPANPTEEAEIEANGAVHNFAVAHMYGLSNPTTAGRLVKYADALDQYAQNFIGSTGNDVYVGTRFNDTISGAGGDDRIYASRGNDSINGGSGSDTLVYSGLRADYVITKQQNGDYTIEHKNGDGTHTLKNVEFATFSDQRVELDTGSETPIGSPPTNLDLSPRSIAEDAALGKVIGTVSATDPEGKPLQYALTDDAGGMFELVGTQIRLKGPLDYETASGHVIGLAVTDDDGHLVSARFTVTVTDVNEAPGELTLSRAIVKEDTEVGSRIGMLSAIDPEGSAVTYSLSANPGGYFKLTADGKLTFAKAVDYEKKQSHTITVQASDSAGKSTIQAIKIDVGDVLESKNGTTRNDTLTGKIGRDKLSGGGRQRQALGCRR
jgi:hypothetical protein